MNIKRVITMMALLGSIAYGNGDVSLAHHASPEMYKNVFKNEHVMVLEMTMKPGQKDEYHMHHRETVYFTQGGTLKIYLPDGSAVEKEIKDGEVMWSESWSHTVENIGDTTVKAIIVEDLKH